ncbi:hypothetical protein GCM10010493_60050 [Streptomyces lavendulae subsp. grasserius]
MDPTSSLSQPPLSRAEFPADLTRLRGKVDLTVRAVSAGVDAPGAHSHTTRHHWLSTVGSLRRGGPTA